MPAHDAALRYGVDVQDPPFVIDVPHDRYFLDDHCANCLEPLPLDIAGLYCSSWCSETSGHVRYMRRVFRDGRINDPDVQLAVRTKNAFLLMGGYRSLGRKLTPRLRAEVKQRDGGRCQECGKPGVEVDHIDGNSDDPSNLQLLCASCHHDKTAQNMHPATQEQSELIRALMQTRVAPAIATLRADDDVTWATEWRSLQAARKERFLAELANAGLKARRNDTHIERVLALIEATERHGRS